MFEDLPAGIARETLSSKFNVRGDLVDRERFLAVLVDIEIGYGTVGCDHDDRLYLLAENVVIDADDCGLDDSRHFLDAVLDLERVDVFAPSDDEITFARRDVDAATFDAAEVAGVEPSTGEERLGVGRGMAPVLVHEQRAANADVALAALGKFVPLVVSDFDFAGGKGRSDAFG